MAKGRPGTVLTLVGNDLAPVYTTPKMLQQQPVMPCWAHFSQLGCTEVSGAVANALPAPLTLTNRRLSTKGAENLKRLLYLINGNL
jgi:hypothetical protein